MNLFSLVDNKVIATPEAYLISEFAVLLKDKKKGIIDMAYVYFTQDYKSPYSAYQEEERGKKVAEDISMTWEASKEVKEACIKYTELQDTTSMRLLKSARSAIAKLSTFFENGGPKDRNYVKNLESLGKLIESVDRLEQKVQKEVSVEGKSKAGRSINIFET